MTETEEFSILTDLFRSPRKTRKTSDPTVWTVSKKSEERFLVEKD